MQRAVVILALAAMCGPASAQRSRAQTPPAQTSPAQTSPTQTSPTQTSPAQTSPAASSPTIAAPAGQSAPQPGSPAAAPAPAANEPQRTTATFGDWVLTCLRPEHAAPACQVRQTLADKGQAVAQTVFARGRPGDPWQMTVVVPVNLSPGIQPRLAGSDAEANFAPIFLTWRRCVPAGCIADTSLTDEQLNRLRSRTENARVLFQDSNGREASLPFSPRGLSQALDALAKEG